MPEDKLLGAMRRNPAADWTISDVETLCRRFGLTMRRAASGSHVNVKHPGAARILTIPARKPIIDVYIRKLVRYIDEHGG